VSGWPAAAAAAAECSSSSQRATAINFLTKKSKCFGSKDEEYEKSIPNGFLYFCTVEKLGALGQCMAC
jgi:hypothetical protein